VKAVETSLTEANTYILSHQVQAGQILSQKTGLSASVVQGLQLPVYNGTESVSDLQEWLHVMTVLGQFKGTLNPAQLVFEPEAKA